MATTRRQRKDAIYDQLARIGKATAAPKRLELLELLCQGPRTVEALAGEAALSVANASQHLQVLRRARLIDAERRGLFVEYRLASDAVARLVLAVREVAAARLPELDQAVAAYLGPGATVEGLDERELVRRIKAGAVTVLDVRPAEEYRAGHLPGAISIPLAELGRRVRELPRDRAIVAYCRGPYCVMAVDAVALLRRKGLTADRLERGVTEWRAAGGRIESERARA